MWTMWQTGTALRTMLFTLFSTGQLYEKFRFFNSAKFSWVSVSKVKRTPLTPIPGRNMPVTSTPTLKRRVAFDVMDSSDCFTPKMPVFRGTPFLSRLGFKTPSGVIHAGDSPAIKHKRTKSTSHPKDFVSPRKHERRCSAHIPGNRRLPSTTDTPFTPSGFMRSVEQMDDGCEAKSLVFTPSVKTRRATPPHLRQNLSSVDHTVSLQ